MNKQGDEGIDFGQKESGALSALEADLLDPGRLNGLGRKEEPNVEETEETDTPDTDDDLNEEDQSDNKDDSNEERDEELEGEEDEQEDSESDDEDEEDEDDREEDEEESEDEDKDTAWLTEQLSDIEDLDMSDPKKAVGELKSRFLEAQRVIEEEAKANEKLIQTLDANPVVESMLARLGEGYTAEEALALSFDLDDLIEMKEDPKVKEKMIEARAERKFNKKEQEKQQEKLQENQKKSSESLESFASEYNLDDKGKKEFTQKLDDVLRPLSEGLVTQEMLDVFYKGLQYDSDLADAQKKARIDEKNKKIEKSKSRKKGDNLPQGKSRKTVSSKKKSSGTIGGVSMDRLAANTDGW